MKPQSLRLVQEGERPAAFEVTIAARPLDELVPVLDREAAILVELRDAMVRQRGFVAANDVAGVNASVDDLGRLLLALEGTRRHRREIMTRLAGNADASLESVIATAEQAGSTPPAALGALRSRLRGAAEEAARAAATNRAVLRAALRSGECFLQTLFSSAADFPPTYAPGECRDRPGPTGLVLNRRA